MTTSIKASADGLSAIIQVGGADKVTIGPNGIEAGSLAPQSVTPSNLSQKLTLGTAVASTSGTAIDFTGIPSWAKRITVMFNGVSTNGTSIAQTQLGSGSFQTTGYNSTRHGIGVSSVFTIANTTGFSAPGNGGPTEVAYGKLVLDHMGNNTWIASGGSVTIVGTTATWVMGAVTLSGTLDRIRITTVNGTDTFDAGSINLIYE